MWPLGTKIKLGACGVAAKNCPADSGPRKPRNRECGVRGAGVVGELFKREVMRIEVNKSEE